MNFNDKINFCNLIDAYENMLTEKQKQIAKLYFFEDTTISEIAELLDISRQAVHDSIEKTSEIMQDLEQKIGFVSLKEKLKTSVDNYKNLKEIIDNL